jgi:glycosyltransferase involved in cell wall biosynthesis
MKILFLNYEFPPIGGGASPVSLEIARGFVRKGHEVDVITMGYKALPAFENRDGIKIFRVKCLRSKKEICHPWEQLTYIFSARNFLKKHLKTHCYDICHCHFIIPTGWLALWVKKNYGIDYVLTSHGSDVLGHNSRFKLLYPILKRPWLKIVAASIRHTAPSDYMIKKIHEIYPSDKYLIIPNGVDLNFFKPLKKEKIILIVARLFINKGVQDVLEAIAMINIPGWQVQIAGEGPYRSFLESRAHELQLDDRVQFLGWVDHSSPIMKALYGKASIFISASYFESFGLTVVEAASAGCYALLSDIGGHRYIINDDKQFFPPGDSTYLAKRIQKAIKMNKRVNEIELKRFAWKSVIEQYIRALGA